MRLPHLVALGHALAIAVAIPQHIEAQEGPAARSIVVRVAVNVPGAAVDAYDRFIEVDDWWDHRFKERPARFLIEPWPGGRFYEQFTPDSPDGALHATVVWAERGKLLRLDGPLGFNGSAVHMVHSISFAEDGDSTRVQVDVSGNGPFEEGWPEALTGVWTHFLVTRFKGHLTASPSTPAEASRSPNR